MRATFPSSKLPLGDGTRAVPQEPHALQVETLTSLKALGRFVDSSQVTAELEGSFPYCHGEWVQFFQVSTITPSAPPPFPQFPSVPKVQSTEQPSCPIPIPSIGQLAAGLAPAVSSPSLPHWLSHDVPKALPTLVSCSGSDPLAPRCSPCSHPTACTPLLTPVLPNRGCSPSPPASGGHWSCCRAASRSFKALMVRRGCRYRGCAHLHPSLHSLSCPSCSPR